MVPCLNFKRAAGCVGSEIANGYLKANAPSPAPKVIYPGMGPSATVDSCLIRIELSPIPFQHVGMGFVFRVSHGFEEVSITREPALLHLSPLHLVDWRAAMGGGLWVGAAAGTRELRSTFPF